MYDVFVAAGLMSITCCSVSCMCGSLLGEMLLSAHRGTVHITSPAVVVPQRLQQTNQSPMIVLLQLPYYNEMQQQALYTSLPCVTDFCT